MLQMNILKVCRICFNEAENSVSLFDETHWRGSTIASLIMECSSVQLQLFEKKYPEQICQECLHDLKQSLHFRRRCQMSEKLLNDFFNMPQIARKNEEESSVSKFPNRGEHFEPIELEFENIVPSEPENPSNKSIIERISAPSTTVFKSKNGLISQPLKKPSHHTKTECMFCEKKFRTSRLLIAHFAEHRINGVITCPKDGINFSLVRSFRKHCLRVHENGEHICLHCGRRLISKNALDCHVRGQHIKLFQYKCQVCGKSFLFNSYLKEHMLTAHSDRRDFACSICGKRFNSGKSARSHEKYHDKSNTFECTHCAATFHFKWKLKQHEEIHGPRIHHCTFCAKSFAMKKYLKKHLEVHLGKQPTSLYFHVKTPIKKLN